MVSVQVYGLSAGVWSRYVAANGARNGLLWSRRFVWDPGAAGGVMRSKRNISRVERGHRQGVPRETFYSRHRTNLPVWPDKTP